MDVPTLLVADGSRRFLQKGEEILRSAGYRMIAAVDGYEVQSTVGHTPLTGALINMELPNIGGIELCRAIKQNRELRLPVVLMSREDPAGVALAETAGADNILFRPIKKEELLFCVRSLVRLKSVMESLERSGLSSESEATTEGEEGSSSFEFLKSFLTVEMKRSRRYGFPLSVMLASLDNADYLEDRFGLPVLRHLLDGLSRAVRRSVRDIDIPVALQDDTILILMPHTDHHGATIVAERLRQRIRRSMYREQSVEIRPTLSIGETTFDTENDHNFSQVVRRASRAMGEAIRNGGDQVVGL